MTETSFLENGADPVRRGRDQRAVGRACPAAWRSGSCALRRFGTLSLQAGAPARDRGRLEGLRRSTRPSTTRPPPTPRASPTSPPPPSSYLPGGAPPPVGSVFRNPELAETYRELGRRGGGWLYDGELGKEIVATVKDAAGQRRGHPQRAAGADGAVRPGGLPGAASARPTRGRLQRHGRVRHGAAVLAAARRSARRSTSSERLPEGRPARIPRGVPARVRRPQQVRRGPGYVDVPLKELLSDGFAKERACLIGDRSPRRPSPAARRTPTASYAPCAPRRRRAATAEAAAEREGPETTHLVVTDRWGNVVAYNITIEPTGGNGIVVPGRGFLLNNELTDFTFGPAPGDPNLPAPGKRPRSSMAPTIVLTTASRCSRSARRAARRSSRPCCRSSSTGSSSGMSLPQAVAAPGGPAQRRHSAGTAGPTQAEQAFIDRYGAELVARGHSFTIATDPPIGELGAATGLEFLGHGKVQAVAEPARRGGGSALVVSGRAIARGAIAARGGAAVRPSPAVLADQLVRLGLYRARARPELEGEARPERRVHPVGRPGTSSRSRPRSRPARRAASLQPVVVRPLRPPAGRRWPARWVAESRRRQRST